jgi:acyl-CoA:6-aminopenicillanic acid acyl transferase
MPPIMTPPGIVDVVCEGSPFEMGVAQGMAFRAKIRAARAMLASLEAFRLAQPSWLPYRCYRWLAERKAQPLLLSALKQQGASMAERLAGIAVGARMSRSAIALFNALEPLLSAASECTACPGACSAVAVRGRRSATGEPMVAHNFDYLPAVQPFYVVRESRPHSGLRAFEFTAVPLVGAVDGLNEAGLCIAYDYAFAKDTPASLAPPISMHIAETLERCRTVTEAAELIASRPRWGGALLMLADADGDIASLELSSTRSHLRRPADGDDVLTHSNAFSSAPLREVQIADDAVYTDRAPTPLRGRRFHQSSDERDRRFQQLLQQTAVFGPVELGAVMADHGPDNIPGDYTPCVHGSYWYTTACLQFYPRSRRLRVAYDTACRAHFQEASFA